LAITTKADEQLPGQQRVGIENQKQKSVIPHLAARDRHAGEDAQSLDREGQPIAFMSAKSGDTALCHRASVYGGVAVGVECCARRQCFAGFGGKQYLAPHQRSRTDVENDRPIGRRKAEGYRVCAESRAGCAGRYDVRRAAGGVQADKSGIDDAFEVIGVASAEIAIVDADRRDPGLFRLGNRDFGAAIDGDIADIVAAIDESGDGCFVYDGDGDASGPGLRLARDREDARQPGEPVAAKRVVDQLVGDDGGVEAPLRRAPARRRR